MIRKAAILPAYAALTLALVQPATAQDNAPPCSLPQGWSAIALRDPQFVVFGELHGTQQAPQFVGTLACALAQQGERVLVAIEQSASDDPALQAAWESPDDRFAERLAQIGWAGRQDGVASAAMFDLLTGLHRQSQCGLPIAVVAFNGPRTRDQAQRLASLPGQGPHEAAQAENIRDAALAGTYDRVLVLVGNFHARRDLVSLSGIAFEPMARRLEQAGPVVTVDMAYSDGTSWNCRPNPGVTFAPGRSITNADITCGAAPTPGNAAYDREPFIALVPLSGDDGQARYDGQFWLGPISASPPAVPALP